MESIVFLDNRHCDCGDMAFKRTIVQCLLRVLIDNPFGQQSHMVKIHTRQPGRLGVRANLIDDRRIIPLADKPNLWLA